ncbi:glutamic acid-rich protein [Octopus bimaculoides]|uniref:Nucleolar protein 7 C-terminal domain-containing protein n=1 Tax=Octopus bimaculoides TaxID=37653 RepID=A0A0L8GFD8_OCTBM|nr:glutamic acid-rich protein [Octopus bimaculoides]|eukprot:XP_014781829.1 PREDICTED: glutamic acid-rich protein-like [Octopus bimaculoides]
MPKYKLKKIKLAEYERKSEGDLSINGDEVQLSEAGADVSNDSDDAPEEVTFSTSKKATLETARQVHENLRDINEKKKEKRKRIQERNTRQKLEKQKAVQVLDEKSSETGTVSKTAVPQLPAAFSDDDDDDDEIDDDDEEKQTDNPSDREDEVEFTEDENFIPLTRGIKVVPLTKRINKTANSALNFRQQSLYGNRIKRDSAKDYFMKKTKKRAR